jgi:hypothetical protein
MRWNGKREQSSHCQGADQSCFHGGTPGAQAARDAKVTFSDAHPLQLSCDYYLVYTQQSKVTSEGCGKLRFIRLRSRLPGNAGKGVNIQTLR